MTNEQKILSDPRLAAAIEELRRLIVDRHPGATFDVAVGDDPAGVYLTATVDTDDFFEVIDVVSNRLLDMQIDEGLPIYFLPSRPWERNLAIMREQVKARQALEPRRVS